MTRRQLGTPQGDVRGLAVFRQRRKPMTHSIVPGRVPAGATPEGDGILIGAGQVQVDVFIDFLCPFCRRFEQAAEPVLAGLVGDGAVRLAYHPMNFLDQASTTNYSTRAAAASGCAADQGRFRQYAHELFAHQPAEGSAGLSDAALAGLAQAAGLDEAALAACLAGGAYLEWPAYVTARATQAGVSATPTVLVAGRPVRPEPQAIAVAVGRATGAR
jgi:protein-disulfide isomerase